mgnify:CR=1 FL=1
MNIISEIENLINNRTDYYYIFIKSIIYILNTNFILYDNNSQDEFLFYLKKRIKNDIYNNSCNIILDNKIKNKKNDICFDLNSTNLNIEETTKKCICYYFSINIIIININTKKHRCIIPYNSEWYSIILINNKELYKPVILEDLLEDDSVQQIFNKYEQDELYMFRNETDISIETKEKISELNKFKIDKLKEIAIEYNINIYTINDSNKNKIKTKQQLIYDIKNYLIN